MNVGMSYISEINLNLQRRSNRLRPSNMSNYHTTMMTLEQPAHCRTLCLCDGVAACWPA